MSYKEIAKRIAVLPGATMIGYVGPVEERLPFYMVKRGRGKKTLLLTGVHGDEPAGPEAFVKFFEDDAPRYEKRFEFTGFCMNPWGLEHFQRGNAFGLNINREFKVNSPSEEVRIIQPHLKKYVAAIDFHETMDDWTPVGSEPQGDFPREFFLWETCADHSKRIGSEIVRRVEKAGYPACKTKTWPRIPNTPEGDRNNDGVIWYPEDCFDPCYAEGTMSDSYLITQGHTDHAFTTETFREWPMEDRVAINLIVIHTILENKLRGS